MDQIELEKLKKIKGEVRGVVFDTDAQYVVKKIGEEALEKLHQKTRELGWEIDYKKIKGMEWYSVGLRVISLMAAKSAFGWEDADIKEMGNAAPKFSFVANTMLKYFLSVPKVFKETKKYWERHYTTGDFEPLEIDEQKKFAIFELRDFNIDPLVCIYLSGYFLRISQFIVKSKEITIEEQACFFKGDAVHKFLVKWI